MPPLRTLLPQVVLFGALGVLVPLQKGTSFLDPVVLGVYACLGVVFAAPAAASGVPVHLAVRRGLLLSWAALLLGIAVVYLSRTVVVGPNLVSLAECGLFGLTISLAASLLSALASSPFAARSMLLGLLGAFYFWPGWLPEIALPGALICATISAGLWILHRRRNAGPV